MRDKPTPQDLDAVRDWFRALSEHVQRVDYEGARRLFAEDMIAFGTFTDFMTGRASAEREQWRRVWGTIRRFRWRLDGVEAIVSPDRLMAAGMAVFDSDGFDPAGQVFDRRGRATVTFARARAADPWVATHTHMSLFRGTPDRSHGRFAGETG